MTLPKQNKTQAGFTLVELAIVLLIIGLLVGGILRGQELIANARNTATIDQTTAFSAAATTFVDTYGALPGDITNAGARLANCGAAGNCNVAGNGDNIVGANLIARTNNNAGFTMNGENRVFWTHLAAANLISGVNPTDTTPVATWGANLPAAKLGGGFHVINANVPAAAAVPALAGRYYLLRSAAAGVAAEGDGASILSSVRAFAIDRKADDGNANAGKVVAVGTANCFAPPTGVYAALATNDCSLWFAGDI
jgi:prepilin-type N-terminal cleavage/methylation domain-containing protein